MESGALIVSDPTQAYLEVPAQGSLPYVQVLAAKGPDGGLAQLGKDEAKHAVWSVHVRLDLREQPGKPWIQAGSTIVNPAIDGSLYAKNRSRITSASTARLWISEERKAVVAIQGLDSSPVIPLRFNPVRLALMALLAALVIALGPRSPLWRVRLDTQSRGQRALFWLAMALVGVWAACAIAVQIPGFTVRTYHQPGAYTYDFNQYGHLADAFLSGHPWLDLPVSTEFAQSPNPYDVYARERLLAADKGPIFWDHVFYQGHWYSYFGPLPALLIFAPYRLLTSLFVPGGLMLPTPAACALLAAGFTLTCSLLIIRLLRRFLPKASLGAAILAVLAFLTGSQVVYLYFRNNFYTVPFNASLLLASLGLWFWLGARRVRTGTGKTSRLWTQADARDEKQPLAPAQVYLSLPRLAAGSLAIAATLGCRQTFIAAGLLAFPIFADELKAIWNSWTKQRTKAPTKSKRLAESAREPVSTSPQPATAKQSGPYEPFNRRRSLAILLAATLPLVPVIAPLLAYNAWRFGSPWDFGNTYQITVVNLNTYKPPKINIAYLLFYYLFLPLTRSAAFPYLQNSPAPLPVWQYTEPGLGGLFVLAPVLTLAFLLLVLPRVRQLLRRAHSLPLLASFLALASVLLLFTSYIAGFDARYLLDFSWLVAIAAALPLAAAAGESTEQNLARQSPNAIGQGKYGHESKRLLVLRCILLLALLATLAMALETSLMQLKTEDVFRHMQAWFTIL
ncbi:hypothetical protein KIM372_06960 [Bombiscardovia nodaiensis]|uniref:Glycosyltransferase n=1 Tax=Bombiscardovia nodaiensis TaxID=2932181 RepID=A0ABN6S9D3_9BIFI|nr:hypothetical protein KIM372_06960 [Bombiscardovia nodaiensis]